jgi:phage regulator Rha-like protein
MLLDFNEKLIRDFDQLERESKAFSGMYAEHLELNVCVLKEQEEEWPTEVSFK